MHFTSFFNSKRLFFTIILIFFAFAISAKSKTDRKKSSKASNETTTETETISNVSISSSSPEWYIYQKTLNNIYKGPFSSLEETLTEWMYDLSLQPKQNFFIGKDRRFITDNPQKYYNKQYVKVATELGLVDNIPDDSSTKEQLPQEEDYTNEQESQLQDVQIELPPVIDTTQQVDLYKKIYLSDFIDIPQYEIPSDDEISQDDDLIADLNDIDSFGRTSLINAVKTGNDWKIRALLAAGADINAKDNDGWTALMYAARYQNDLNILNILLEQNPDVRTLNNYGLSALIIASCYNDNPEIIEKLISFYSPAEKEVQKAFILLLSTQSISEHSLVNKMHVFLDKGLPINSYYDGKTPIMYACKFSSSTKAIKLLLDNKANISVRSSEGKTAFEYATENKNLKHDDIYWSLNKR